MASFLPSIPSLRHVDHSEPSETSSSSSSSSSYGSFSSPKPHKANNAAWEAMRRLRGECAGRVGLEHFRLIRRLGSGDIGSVYLCKIRNPAAQCLYAMKVVDMEAVAARKKAERAETEKEILCMLDHPFLPTLFAHFHASHYSCLVMEFCPGGDLYSARLNHPSRRFSTSSAKFYASETLVAIEYLHMMGIVYRDLKPENVLVRHDGHVMLSDFDLSLRSHAVVVPKLLNRTLTPPPSPTTACASCFSLRRRSSPALTTTITEHADHSINYDDGNKYNSKWDRTAVVVEPTEARSNSFVGTHEYVAPEVILGRGHGSAVDWWTYGVFLYEMLFGATPFKGRTNEETLKNILKQPLRFPGGAHEPKEEEEDDVAEMAAAKDLIRRLLVKNPKKRMGSLNGSVEIKRHHFFDGVNWALIRSVRPPRVPAEEARNRKMKGGGGSRGRSPASLMLPRVLSKKERDQPFQIPSDRRQHHNHHFDFF